MGPQRLLDKVTEHKVLDFSKYRNPFWTEQSWKDRVSKLWSQYGNSKDPHENNFKVFELKNKYEIL